MRIILEKYCVNVRGCGPVQHLKQFQHTLPWHAPWATLEDKACCPQCHVQSYSLMAQACLQACLFSPPNFCTYNIQFMNWWATSVHWFYDFDFGILLHDSADCLNSKSKIQDISLSRRILALSPTEMSLFSFLILHAFAQTHLLLSNPFLKFNQIWQRLHELVKTR